MRQFSDERKILDALAATGQGVSVDVRAWRHVIVLIYTASSANLTVKCVGTIADTEPSFTAAQSASAPYEFLNMVDLQSNNVIAGDTGIAFAGTDDVRLLEVNTNGLKWLNFRVTAYAAGNISVKVMGFNND